VALSVGIFRHRSQRPFQRAIQQKQIIKSVVPPAVVETPGFIASFIQQRAYKFIQRDRVPPDQRWQITRPRSFTKFVPRETPGVLASIKKQRQQFDVVRPPSEVRQQLQRPFPFRAPTTTLGQQEPGYLAAVKKYKKQLGQQRPDFDVRWQLKRQERRLVVPAITPPVPAETPGFLAAIQNQRHQFHLRREPIDSIWRQRRPTIFSLFVPGEPAWLGAIRNQRKQFVLGRRTSDTYWKQRRALVLGRVVAAPVSEPGHLAAVKSLRKQFGRAERVFDYRQYRKQFRHVKRARFHDIGYLAAVRQHRKQLGREREFVDVWWQLNRTFPFRAPPIILGEPAPGWLEALYKRRVQLPSLVAREVERVRWQLNRPAVFAAPAPSVVETPGFLAATRSLRKQLGVERPEFDVRWQIRWRQIVFGVAVVPSPRDIGWLVNWIIKRGYGHNLRR